MADLRDGESVEVQGSARLPYILKNVGGVYSCTCPAWRNQSVPIERRTCKHLRAYRGDQAEKDRLGQMAVPSPAPSTTVAKDTPQLLLAESWDNQADLAGWWMSEKLDGVRAWWDGKQFLSRQGNRYHAPAWFTEGLPNQPLDGELWLDRRAFQRTVSIVRRQDQSDHWRQIAFVVFDAPSAAGPFEERLAALEALFRERRLAHARPLEQTRCKSVDHLRQELARVESLGGEGLMLREPGSRYQSGRSSTLLKVKTFHDAEGRVVEHLPGKGRHAGRLGAVVVELPSGLTFSVGTGFSDALRENPPAVGSLITYRYQELTERGVPRFPAFVRVRSESPVKAPAQTPSQGASKRPPAKPQAKTGPKRRYFELVGGGSAKFWEIGVEGKDVTVRFGRIGAQGQTQVKSFADAAAACAHAEKLIAEKTAKGYAESDAP